MRNVYQVVSGKNNVSAIADQGYCCNKLFIERKSLDRHMNVCGHLPGIVYKFENKNIQTFFDNMKLMGDIPFLFILISRPQQAKKFKILMKIRLCILFLMLL